MKGSGTQQPTAALKWLCGRGYLERAKTMEQVDPSSSPLPLKGKDSALNQTLEQRCVVMCTSLLVLRYCCRPPRTEGLHCYELIGRTRRKDCADAMTCAGEDLFAASSRRKRGQCGQCGQRG